MLSPSIIRPLLMVSNDLKSERRVSLKDGMYALALAKLREHRLALDISQIPVLGNDAKSLTKD